MPCREHTGRSSPGSWGPTTKVCICLFLCLSLSFFPCLCLCLWFYSILLLRGVFQNHGGRRQWFSEKSRSTQISKHFFLQTISTSEANVPRRLSVRSIMSSEKLFFCWKYFHETTNILIIVGSNFQKSQEELVQKIVKIRSHFLE